MAGTYQWDVLRARTKQFAIRVVKLYRALPRTRDAQVSGMQVLRSGTLLAANYRAVCRARSKAEFVAKMGVWLLRRRTKRYFGSSYWSRPVSSS